MIGEIPTPQPPFVDASSPWLDNIKVARQAVDDKLVSKLSPAGFVPLDDMLAPKKSLSVQPPATPSVPASFQTPKRSGQHALPPFKKKVPPPPPRITRAHTF